MSQVFSTGNQRDYVLSTGNRRRLYARHFGALVGLGGEDGTVEVGSRRKKFMSREYFLEGTCRKDTLNCMDAM